MSIIAEQILADWKDKLSLKVQRRDALQIEIDTINNFMSDLTDLVMEQRKKDEP